MYTGVKNLCQMSVPAFLLNGRFYQSMLLLSAFVLDDRRWFVFKSVMVSLFASGFFEQEGAFIEWGFL